jgi:predicted ester cyclase
MNPEEMKSTIRDMNDASWHTKDLDKVYSFYADEIVFQRAPFPPVSGKEANVQGDRDTLAAFTDIKSTIHELVVEGDTAIAHWSWQGVHTGTLQSLGIPATGKQVQFSGCSMYHSKMARLQSNGNTATC